MMYDIAQETMPREELEALQTSRLIRLVEKLYHNVPLYREKCEHLGVRPDHIRSLKDLNHLPFMEKQDLRDTYPYGLFATPRENIVRLHVSSGTTGKATVVGYTRRDVDTWATLMARCLMAAGGSRRDMVHNAYGYGLFTGGLGMHYGTEKLGATIMPFSGGGTRRQIMLMKDFGSTILCSTPSYAVKLYETMLASDVRPQDLQLRIGIFGAEPWSEAMRQDIETKLGIKAYDIYGLSEIMGPGVAIECETAQNGLHLWEDHFIPEIINPETGEVLPPGETGELVITTLTKEGIPLIRYRTRDMTAINPIPCPCGRTHVRMDRIKGRSDDMLIIRGVNVFPSQIESIILETQGLSSHYQLIIRRQGAMDTLEARVEIDENLFSDEIKHLQHIEAKIQNNIKEFLGVTAKVSLVEPQSIERSQGKARRILDLRS